MNLPKLTLQNMSIRPGRRILVTSDIHGHLNHLQRVLEKANFNDDDILFIVGDIIEKGPQSLNTLRYVMRLCQRGNVVPLIGNVDAWRLHMINDISAHTIEGFYNYLLSLRSWYGTSFYDELTKELGFICQSPDEILLSRDAVIAHFQSEFDFLAALPSVVETQNYIFVHGGLREKNLADNLNKNIFDLLKYGNFCGTEHIFDKYIVVGHWPVTLYDDKIPNSNPVFNNEKHIIAIDGGCGLKEDGQLNLLCIPSIDCKIDEIDYFYHDEYPVYTARDSQAPSDDSINILWHDNKINILERKDDFVYAEHIASGRKLWIYESYLMNEGTRCNDYTDYALSVEAGDKISLIKTTSRGYIVKKNGVSGWYYGRLDCINN